MTDYPKALAAAREAHTYVKHLGMTRADALRDLLAALDAARGEARQKVKDTLTDYLDHYPHPELLDAVMAHFVTAAPPAAAVPAANVTPMRQPRLDLSRLVDAIDAAIYEHGKGLTVTECIGALELAKLELFKEQEK